MNRVSPMKNARKKRKHVPTEYSYSQEEQRALLRDKSKTTNPTANRRD